MNGVLLILVLWLPSAADALTLADLRTESRALALDNGNRLRFSTATIDGWLNEAQRVANLDVKAIRKSSLFETSAGTTYYALPSDFLQIARVTWKYRELGETTPEALAGKVGWNWIEAKGQPTSYYINFSSRTKIAFYPWPDTGQSTGTVRYEYWAQTTNMKATTDEPFGGTAEFNPHHHFLAYYAAGHMAAIDGRADLAGLYLGLFKDGLDRFRREINDRPSYRPGLTPGMPLNRTVP
ncbi:MAG: hypothetical protein QME60_01285 [Verrucomicrobiota bacterium]|nr:hypothetical protein [Verrucomicrobiota bacterium]